ncbi:hypothetical protein BD310DRAFT_910708 [Dichomitus squalens]|uniref:Uncharacterized protein n=1 Tax=Dichomitus squalens TaxID=114155 RepID=A0A4V2K686_9APHY|nr:hypothetical protein BD310DRAFT_910708 [Dichomitus squalens]
MPLGGPGADGHGRSARPTNELSPGLSPTRPGPSPSPPLGPGFGGLTPLPASSPPPQGHLQARIRDPNYPEPYPLMLQSLIMPHPGAPKPATETAGPMYGRPQPAQELPSHDDTWVCLLSSFIMSRMGRAAYATDCVRASLTWRGPWVQSQYWSMDYDISAHTTARTESTDVERSGAYAWACIKGLGLGPTIGQPIKRANFTPTVHTSRPRSRSFSRLTGGDLTISVEALGEGSITNLAMPAAIAHTAFADHDETVEVRHGYNGDIMNVPAPQRATVSISPTVNNTVVTAGPPAVVAPPLGCLNLTMHGETPMDKACSRN